MPTPKASNERELRRKVAISCRILAMLGLVKETTGHVSARIPGTSELFIRGRGEEETGLLFTREVDVLRADFDAKILSKGAHVGLPNEFPIHGETYKARPEVGCVVHAHPPSVLLCGITGLELRPIFGAYDPSAMKLAIDGVPVFRRSVTVTTPQLAWDMLKAMGEKSTCLMLGHGITVTGATVEEATIRAIKLETLANITWQAARQGPPHEIAAQDIKEYLRRGFGSSKRSSAEPVWQYYVTLLRQKGLLSGEFSADL